MIPGKSRDPPSNERIACRRLQPQFKESISRYLSLHKDKLIAAEQYSAIARPGLLLTQFTRNFDRFQLYLDLFQVSLAAMKLLRRGETTQHQLVRQIDPFPTFRLSCDQPPGQVIGLLVNERTIHHEQGLNWRDRGRPHWRTGIRICSIKNGQIRMPLEALRHEIDTAPIGLVDSSERIVLCKVPGAGMRKGVKALL